MGGSYAVFQCIAMHGHNDRPIYTHPFCMVDYKTIENVQRFENIRLALLGSCTDRLYDRFRQVITETSEVFSGHKIEVKIERDDLSKSPRMTDYLKVFQLLRCKTFKITGASTDITTPIEQVVTSKNPVIDLSFAMEKLHFAITLLSTENQHSIYMWARRKHDELHQAVVQFDIEQFKEVRRVLLEQFDKEAKRLKNQALDGDLCK